MHIFLVSGIGSLIFAGLGFGVYSILEKKVPEFLDFLSELGGGSGSGFRHSSVDSYSTGSTSNYPSDGEIKLAKADDSMSSDFAGGDIPTPKMKDGKFGDHIMISNIAIKNEPKLMAEAIRTIMSQDEPESPKQ
jgi:hypothetical protein